MGSFGNGAVNDTLNRAPSFRHTISGSAALFFSYILYGDPAFAGRHPDTV
jgi:hypothetical protein